MPGSEDGAEVRVADDGWLTWTRDYWDQTAAIAFEPEFCGWITNPGHVAASMVATITPAMSCLCRAGRERMA